MTLGNPPLMEFHHLGSVPSTSFPSSSTETHHKFLKKGKQGIILEGKMCSQGKEGSRPSSRGMPASQCCLCICRSVPNASPRGSLPYCSLIALLRKRGALTAGLMSTGGTDPFAWDPVPQGAPVPDTQGRDNPAVPWSTDIPPCKPHFRGCGKHPGTLPDPDVHPGSQGRCFPGSPPCSCRPPRPAVPRPSPAVSPPQPLRVLPQVREPERGGAGRPRGGAAAAPGRLRALRAAGSRRIPLR